MNQLKEIFLDNNLKVGGFYELAIQVCSSLENNPIKLYTEFIWSLKNVEGPFDKSFKLIEVDVENVQHNGMLNLENYNIPFLTYNIREDEPIETGYNWFDICFYTAAIEKVFGSEYQTWSDNPNVPKELADFLHKVLKQLYEIYPFQLAIIDFEVSGQYYFDNLKKSVINNWSNASFYVGDSLYESIMLENRKYVTKVEDL